MYDGHFKPKTEIIIPLLKTSILLGMKELKQRSLEYINATLTKESALTYLKFSHLRCSGMNDVILGPVHVAVRTDEPMPEWILLF